MVKFAWGTMQQAEQDVRKPGSLRPGRVPDDADRSAFAFDPSVQPVVF
jgi:hypothetical protein